MNTIGWLFILAGMMIARQVSKGRVQNIGEDLSDAFIAFASGDTQALGEILTRKGEDAGPTTADLAIYNLTSGVTGGMTTAAEAIAGGIGKGFEDLEGRLQKSLSLAAVMLGHKAKGYRWAATGPDYYDCSGLMWRATQLIGYKGSRFTTASLPSLKQFRRLQDREVNVDDIVHWPAGHGGVTGHMGVVTGGDMFYSARSVRSGIGEAKISTFRKAKPRYYRYIGG